jgi:inhibitor of cysteine peptidase
LSVSKNLSLRQCAQHLIAATAAMSLLTACGLFGPKKPPPPPPLSVTEANSGGSVTLARDQRLIVRLPSNPSTGYRWSLAQQAAGVLEPDGAPTYEQGSTGSATTGAGGTETWKFVPTRAGEETLRLEYRRLWETDAAPARVVSYKVTVRE